MDRSKRPDIHTVGMPNVEQLPVSRQLDNGVTLHTLISDKQLPIVRLDIAIYAGSAMADKALVARGTSELLVEGIPGMTATQISDRFESCGARIWHRTLVDYTILSVVVLDKFFGEVAPLIEQIIKVPTFPEREFGIYLDGEKQDHKLRKSKPSVVCQQEFRKLFYKEGCVLSRLVTDDILNTITRDDMVNHHRQYYGPGKMHLIVAGNPSEMTMNAIEAMFGGKWGAPMCDKKVSKAECREWTEQLTTVDFKNAKQASICMGRPMPTYFESADRYSMRVVNTIFGGYFGSRLMQNIREEKGLTYGIGSMCAMAPYEGSLKVKSEVAPDKWQTVIDEVFNEMRKLQEEPVGEDELSMVKNTMKGGLIQDFDGLHQTVSSLHPVLLRGLDIEGYKKFYQTIDSITPEEIMALAKKYLVPEAFKIVVVK